MQYHSVIVLSDWVFSLRGAEDIEHHFWNSPTDDMEFTKMAMARRLQVRDNFDDASSPKSFLN